MSSPWSFEPLLPRLVRRDAFEAEFFTGEEENEEIFGRTDALVREVIQNSLDARVNADPVRVRFVLSEETENLPSARSAQYLEGLIAHLDATCNEFVNLNRDPPEMSHLVIEDFGTTGLTGDITLNQDPTPEQEQAERQAFYWFWRNVGRSGKSGSDRGRWGLGKTVFPATSRINTLYGLTVRSSDGRRYLMGQAITRIHRLNNRQYVPEGFYHDPDAEADIQMPFESDAVIEAFQNDFRLERGGQPGLSIVVPYPFPTLNAREILRSVIVHYFYPILRGDLVVDVSGRGLDSTVRVSHDTVREVADGLEWTGKRSEKKHAPPPFEFAAWAIHQQATGGLVELQLAGEHRVPDWNEPLIPSALLEDLRARFDRCERLAIRVPMTVELRNGEKQNAHFDVFINRDENLERAEDLFIREGMTIPQVSSLAGHRGLRALVVVEHGPLSRLLGDTEGPAHTDWSTGESRPDRDFARWKRRISFVRTSPAKLLALLSPPPEGLDEDWLKDIFSIDEPLEPGPRRRRRRRGPRHEPLPPPPPPPPPPQPRPFEVIQTEGGFRIRRSPDAEGIPGPIVVLAAYDVAEGNALAHYSPLDFQFDEDADEEVRIELAHRGLRFQERRHNRLVIVPESADFELEATGFRTISADLKIKADELGGGE